MTTGPGQSPAPRRTHVYGLDGIRGLAAIAVLFSHVTIHTAPDARDSSVAGVLSLGGEGLTVFFALSGFLLFGPYLRAVLDGRPLPSLSRYLANRGLRIFPAYIAIFLLVNFVLATSYLHASGVLDSEESIGLITNPGQIGANLLLIQNRIPPWLKTGIGPA